MARVQIDIMTDDDGDILIKDGNLVFGDATRKHQQVIVLANEGDIKYDPLQGVGVEDWLLEDGDSDMLSLQHKIQNKLERDGCQVQKIDLSTFPNPIIKADYE